MKNSVYHEGMKEPPKVTTKQMYDLKPRDGDMVYNIDTLESKIYLSGAWCTYARTHDMVERNPRILDLSHLK